MRLGRRRISLTRGVGTTAAYCRVPSAPHGFEALYKGKAHSLTESGAISVRRCATFRHFWFVKPSSSGKESDALGCRNTTCDGDERNQSCAWSPGRIFQSCNISGNEDWLKPAAALNQDASLRLFYIVENRQSLYDSCPRTGPCMSVRGDMSRAGNGNAHMMSAAQNVRREHPDESSSACDNPAISHAIGLHAIWACAMHGTASQDSCAYFAGVCCTLWWRQS